MSDIMLIMTNEEVLKLTKDKPDSYVQIIKAHYRVFYDEVNLKYTGRNFGEKLYKHIYGSDNKCKDCDNITKFISFITGYNQYCSKKCANNGSLEKRTQTLMKTLAFKRYLQYEKLVCLVCGKEFEVLKSKQQKCCSEKCCAINMGNFLTKTEKMKKTKLEKYGDENYVNSEQAKITNMEKYGVDNPSKSEEVKNRIVETNREVY